jgi:hypothetical protein
MWQLGNLGVDFRAIFGFNRFDSVPFCLTDSPDWFIKDNLKRRISWAVA